MNPFCLKYPHWTLNLKPNHESAELAAIQDKAAVPCFASIQLFVEVKSYINSAKGLVGKFLVAGQTESE